MASALQDKVVVIAGATSATGRAVARALLDAGARVIAVGSHRGRLDELEVEMPGVIGERIHFLVATVDPSVRGVPTEDGSPTEERAAILFVPLHEALAACEDGRVEDAKTEIALRRLRDRFRP